MGEARRLQIDETRPTPRQTADAPRSGQERLDPHFGTTFKAQSCPLYPDWHKVKTALAGTGEILHRKREGTDNLPPPSEFSAVIDSEHFPFTDHGAWRGASARRNMCRSATGASRNPGPPSFAAQAHWVCGLGSWSRFADAGCEPMTESAEGG